MAEDKLYSAIEAAIIRWNLDGTKTAGELTREIIIIIKKAHHAITRIKGKDYAPNVHEIQEWIDKQQDNEDNN